MILKSCQKNDTAKMMTAGHNFAKNLIVEYGKYSQNYKS